MFLKNNKLLILQFVVYAICLLYVRRFDASNVVLLFVPIFYLLCNFAMNLKGKGAFGIAMNFWQVVLFIKYYLMPLYLVCTGHRTTIGTLTSPESFFYGCLMLLYEMFWIYALYYYVYTKATICTVVESKGFTIPFHCRRLFYFTLVTGMFLFVLFRDYFISTNAFEILNVGETDTKEREASIGSVFVQFWKEWSFGVFIVILAKKYLQRKQKFYMALAFALLLFYMFLNLSSSRWTLLFLVINASYLFYLVFGNQVKKYICVLAGLSLFLLISISVFKFSWYFESTDGSVVDLLLGQLQSYFSGPNLLAQTIDMNDQKWFSDNLSLSTFMNDVTGSIPIVAKFVDQTDRINVFFNRYVLGWNGNLSQIMPMTGIGYSYFGMFFAPLLTILFTRIGMYFDSKSLKMSNLFYKYVYIYISLWFLLAIAMNTQVIIGNVIVHSVPLLLLYKMLSFTVSYGKKRLQSFNFSASV